MEMNRISDVITFDSEINAESIGAVMDNCQKYIKIDENSKILIYFSSGGGSIAHADLFVDHLNQIKDNVILHAFGRISSSAFYIFFKFQGEKYIKEHTYATVHRGSKEINSIEMFDKESFDYFMLHKIIPKMDKAMINLFNDLGFTREELERIHDGRDLYLDTKKLKILLAKN